MFSCFKQPGLTGTAGPHALQSVETGYRYDLESVVMTNTRVWDILLNSDRASCSYVKVRL